MTYGAFLIVMILIIYYSSEREQLDYYKLTSIDSIDLYFEEIATKNEFYNLKMKPMKWKKKKVSVSIIGKPNVSDLKIVKEVFLYIGSLTGIDFKIEKTDEPDITICFNDYEYLSDSLHHVFSPKFLKRAGFNCGLFQIYRSFFDRTSIDKSFIFINSGPFLYYRKHVILEEIIQSMGFPNDSYQYPNSIFYQGVSNDTVFTPIDSAIIKILYY